MVREKLPEFDRHGAEREAWQAVLDALPEPVFGNDAAARDVLFGQQGADAVLELGQRALAARLPVVTMLVIEYFLE